LFELFIYDLKDSFDALLASTSQTEQDWPANQHCIGPVGKRLETVLAISNSAIEEYCDILAAGVLHGLYYLWEYFDRCGSCVKLSCSVIGDVDTVSTVLYRKDSILITHDSFSYHFET
jgi:hypothetical protein